MKKFHFPLERVRCWRDGQAALEELKLEQLRGRLAALQEAKIVVEAERAQSERTVLGQPSMAGAELQSLDAYRLHSRSQVRDLESQERQMQEPLERQCQRVIAARRDAELLERLKRKALDAWRAANDREQETLATEMYLAKRVRER